MRIVLSVALAIGLFSCGNIKVLNVKENQVSLKKSGVRFYRPALHVLITPEDQAAGDEKPKDNKEPEKNVGEKLKLQFLYLPDFSNEYIITWQRGLIGNVNPKFTLSDGWNLTGFESEINTGVSAALELSGSFSKAIEALNGFERGLYKVLANEEGGYSFRKVVLQVSK